MLEQLRSFLRPGLRINNRLYLATLPLALLASVATYASGSAFLISLQYLLANLLSFSLVALVYVIAKSWIRPEGNQVLIPIAAFGLLLGFSKQVSTAVAVVWLGLEGSVLEALAIRAVTPLIGLWSALAIAVISGAQARFETLRKELIAERVRKLGARNEGSVELKQFVSEATELLGQSGELERKELTGLIRNIVEHKLRPLSHELWEREEKKTPGFGSRELTIRALTQKPYRLIAISSLFALGSLQPVIVLSGNQWSISLLLITAPVAASLWIANLIRRRSELAKSWFIGVLFATSFVGGFSGSLALWLFGLVINPLLILTSSWWLGTLILVVGIFSVAIEDFGKLREELNQLAAGELDIEAQSSLREVSNRELANLLHSKTQNHMLAQAMRLESGSDVAEELLELKRLLTNLSKPELSELSLEELKTRWQGLIQISWSIGNEPDLLTLRLIEEAISNSFRHGLASEIEVSKIDKVLVIRDNGLGPTSGAPGLGSRLYGSAGAWELSALPDGGAELRIELS